MSTTCLNKSICHSINKDCHNCAHYNEAFSRTEILSISEKVKNLKAFSAAIERTYKVKLAFS